MWPPEELQLLTLALKSFLDPSAEPEVNSRKETQTYILSYNIYLMMKLEPQSSKEWI